MKGRELSSLENYYVSLTNEKVTKVINAELEYYVRQAVGYKRMFIFLSVITMVLNSSIPVINQIEFAHSRLVITILSSISLVVTGIFSLISIKETWSRYRESAEKLKSICNKFNAKASPYNSENERTNELLIIHDFEELNLAERKLWKMQESQKQDSSNITQGNEVSMDQTILNQPYQIGKLEIPSKVEKLEDEIDQDTKTEGTVIQTKSENSSNHGK